MPLPFFLPWDEPELLDILPEPSAQVQQVVQQRQVDEELIVRAEIAVYDPVGQVYTFSRGVQAQFGGTVIHADDLEVRVGEGEEWARARGNVRLEDPDVQIDAEDLEFAWRAAARTIRTRNVRVRIANVRIDAAEATFLANRWEFIEARGTHAPEAYWVSSRRIVIEPGRQGSIERPTFEALGRRLITLPNRRFNLDPRTQGLALPSVSYRSGEGVGASWRGGWLLDDRTNLFVSAGAFPRAYPGASAVLSRSLLSEEEQRSILTPGNDLDERFRFGYMTTVEVDSQESERSFLQARRLTASIGTHWNAAVAERRVETAVNKPIELVGEFGGPTRMLGHTLGLWGQLRLHEINERGGPSETRAVANASLELPRREIAPRVSSLGRLDTGHIFGSNLYGWVRGELGAQYQPAPQVRLSGVLVQSFDHGRPVFQFDRLVETGGVHLRVDLELGPTELRYMWKYDSRLGWYDHEYMVSQVWGGFEPFVIYRHATNDLRFGVRLRLGEFYRILERRRTDPIGAAPRQISPMQDGRS
jgi:hypothetical protein